MKKIEKFLLFFALLASLGYVGHKELNTPKKKDYIGRIILSLFGLIVFIFLLILLWAVVGLPIIGLFK